MGIQRQIHCLKDTNEQGVGYELLVNYVGIGSIYTIKSSSWKKLNRRPFYLNTAIIQIVSGLCRSLEFLQAETFGPAGYGIIRDV